LKMKESVVKTMSIDDFTRIIPAGQSHVVESSLGDTAE